MAGQGLILREGSIVDATILSAPSSTKNSSGERDPEMYQIQKGNEWDFGMKIHIGADDMFGLIHSIATMSANVHDVVVANQLLHGKEQRVWGDAGYLGIGQRPEHQSRKVDWQIAMRPGKRTKLSEGDPTAKLERLKASVRAKVEHSFFFIKRILVTTKFAIEVLPRTLSDFTCWQGLAI